MGLAGEWLLDNFHLIEAQAGEIRTGMPPGYYHALPKLVDAPLLGLPRVYGIVWAFVAHTDSNFDAALLGRDALAALWEIENHCRAVLKHGDPREDMRELCDTIRAMIPPACLES